MFDPLFRSHTLTVLSSDPETILLPSGVIATEMIAEVWPSRVFSRLPEARSHSLIVLSHDPETIFVLSGVILLYDNRFHQFVLDNYGVSIKYHKKNNALDIVKV